MVEKTYDQGLLDGKIDALESIIADHKSRLDGHSDRLRLLERAMWIMLGVVSVVQFVPMIFSILSKLS